MARGGRWGRGVVMAAGAVAAAGWLAYRAAERALLPRQPQLAIARGNRLLQRGRRVLAAVGRWEDLELLAGGTLRMLARAGSHITVAGPGPVPLAAPWLELARPQALMPEEFPADEGYSARVQGALKRLWTDLVPDVVLVFDPVFPVGLLAHPAHILVANAALDLAQAGRSPQAQLLLFATRRANVLVDITPVAAAKFAALDMAAAATSGRASPLTRAQRAAAGVLGRMYGRAAGARWAEGLRIVPAG